MQVLQVDPRVEAWEVKFPRYRVYFWSPPDGGWAQRNSALDMATKHQDTLHEGEWATTGGLGARMLIAAFAGRQWRLGEKLSHRGVTTVAHPDGSPDGDGGAGVVARFADCTVRLMEETKFVYNCARRGFAHVVIISARVAEPA